MKENLITLAARDNYPLQVKISEPDHSGSSAVIFVNGSGPNTYDNKRQMPDGSFFNYFDMFAKEFTKLGVAFCRYSSRGTYPGDKPQFFADINAEEYKTYLPHTSVSDVEVMVEHLNGMGYSKIFLLGWSEGTIIAPLVALNNNVKIEMLLLAGYCNINVMDNLKWQLNGNTAIITFREYLDYDRKGYISKEDFKEDRYGVRKVFFGKEKFRKLDINRDGKLTAEDFAPDNQKHFKNMLDAIERNDDEWLMQNHGVTLTSGWFKEHGALDDNRVTLPKLDLPIHIFAGDFDASTPIFHADDIDSVFQNLGKSNLTVHRFKNHNHDLNYMNYIIKHEPSEGIKAIFDIVEQSI